jgi:hypothetical protein
MTIPAHRPEAGAELIVRLSEAAFAAQMSDTTGAVAETARAHKLQGTCSSFLNNINFIK